MDYEKWECIVKGIATLLSDGGYVEGHGGLRKTSLVGRFNESELNVKKCCNDKLMCVIV